MPIATNLATLAVLATAMVWSGAQRPASQPVSLVKLASAQPAPTPGAAKTSIAPGLGHATWSAPAPTQPRELYQTITYTSTSLR